MATSSVVARARTRREPDVALFLPALSGGGAERMILNLSAALADRGFVVDLVVAVPTGVYMSDVPTAVRLVSLDVRRTLMGVLPLVRYLRRERPRVMMSALDNANIVGVAAARAARVTGAKTRVIVSTRNTISLDTRTMSPRRRFVTLRALGVCHRLADDVATVSNGAADDLARTLGLTRERIHVIYNPVVTPGLLRAAGASITHPWLASGEPPVILAVGRLTQQKDFAMLVRAFARIRASRAARLLVLGEGEEREALEALARDLGVADDVSFMGFVANPYAYMARAAVVALSSRWEGLPAVLIESLALGTPVVSTDCESGPREILRGGRDGPLVPVGDDARMADAIASVLDRPRPSIPDDVWRPFTLDVAVDQYVRLMRLDAEHRT
jgi:glycosyltransferase involved in cell wall biosynthesis